MLRKLFLSAALVTVVSYTATAQPSIPDFGFGLILLEPTGLTAKGSIDSDNSWDAAIGRGWFGSIQIHADYLWSINAFSSRNAGLYAGLGPVIGFGRSKGILVKGDQGRWYYYDDEDATALGARGVFGVNGFLASAPLELFGELGMLVGLTPVTGIGLQFAIGLRYYP